MKRVILFVSVVSLWFGLATSAEPRTQKEEEQPKQDKVAITGILVNEDGSAAKGRTVFVVFRNKDTGEIELFYVFDEKGSMSLLLSTKTDNEGRFTLEITGPKNEADTEKVELGLENRPPSRSRVTPLTKVKIDGKTKKVDLGRLVLP